MKTTPVISSVVSPDFLATLVQEHYPFSPNVQCSILRTGINHAYFICEGDQKRVLRLYSHQWRSREDIVAELELLLQMHEAGISVSYPIADSQGEFIHEVEAPEGMRYMVLFSYAPGRKLRKLTPKHCHTMGLLMGKMHKLMEGRSINRISYDFDTLMELPYQHALRFFDKKNDEMIFARKAIELSKQQLGPLAGQLRQGVVHLDLWYDNLNVTSSGHVTLFDFDFCGNGWLALDLAYTVMQLYHTEPDKEIFEKKRTAFYKGYESIETIPALEKELLSHLGIAVWVFYLGVQSRRFNDWSNIFLGDHYLQHYIGLLKGWLKFSGTVV